MLCGMNKIALYTAALAANSDTPDTIQLFPAGNFRAGDGRPTDAPHWQMDAATAARLNAALAARKTRLLVDYEHQTLYARTNGRPNPAAGWIEVLEWQEGKGLYARVQWTAAAKAAIAAGEYRYISPMFEYDASGAILSLLPAALTNTPALDGMDAVTLAAALSLFATPDESPKPEENDMNELEKHYALLGLDYDKDKASLAAALAALTEQLGGQTTLKAALSAPPDAGKYVSVDVMSGLQKQVADLQAQLTARTQADNAALVTAALADGRLLPAQKDWAESLVKSNPQALTDYLATVKPLAALTKTQTDGKAPPEAGKVAALSAEETAAAKMLGMTVDEYQKTVKGDVKGDKPNE